MFMCTCALERNRPPKADSQSPARPAVPYKSRTQNIVGEACPAAGAASCPGHAFGQVAVLAPAAGEMRTKLAVNEPGDEYEREADRVADEVTATQGRTAVSVAPPRIQRMA